MKKRSEKENKEFEKIIKDIKSVKIQGAENVARAGIKAYALKPDKKSIKKILETRPTEPLLQNAIKIITKTKNKERAAKEFLKELKKSHKKMVIEGAKLIKNDMNIYSHCHSSSVIDILVHAKKVRKKKFVVYTTEVEPLLQGRKTAKELAKNKIKVIIAPDLAAKQLMTKCDLFLFGADAYTKTHVINKIGTATLCRIAKENRIPRYSCGVSMKYTTKIKIEQRSGKEVWSDNKKLIEIENPAFSKTKYEIITGIISEHGILKQKKFLKEAKKKLKQMKN